MVDVISSKHIKEKRHSLTSHVLQENKHNSEHYRTLILFEAFCYCSVAIISSNYLKKRSVVIIPILRMRNSGSERQRNWPKVTQARRWPVLRFGDCRSALLRNCTTMSDHNTLLFRACAPVASSFIPSVSSLHSLCSSCLQGTCLHRIMILRTEDTKVFLSRPLIKQGI